uniref:Uncharacterized protein n=1 Tax=Neisseria meningitidis alpha153 TaxID=663926 RepID=C6SFN5_NEIME|nr:hypothetical protein predicted by Glimmer/Critica [Neisseria meningitidis alpha153]
MCAGQHIGKSVKVCPKRGFYNSNVKSSNIS